MLAAKLLIVLIGTDAFVLSKINLKQASLDATPSKCIRNYASAVIAFTHLYAYDLDLCALTLKMLSAISTPMTNICVSLESFHYVPRYCITRVIIISSTSSGSSSMR